MDELFRKVDASEKMPTTDGEYYTNFGSLEFRDGKFWVNYRAGKKCPTVVEWWLERV